MDVKKESFNAEYANRPGIREQWMKDHEHLGAEKELSDMFESLQTGAVEKPAKTTKPKATE